MALALDHVDTSRATVARSVLDLTEEQLRATPLSSGWSPLEPVDGTVGEWARPPRDAPGGAVTALVWTG